MPNLRAGNPEGETMIPLRNLFEGHLTVTDLKRSMAFFGDTLGLELARVFPERRVAFYWIGGPGQSMLGVWAVGTAPQRLSLHLAFRVDLPDLLRRRSVFVRPMSLRATSRGIRPVSRWCLPGCRRPLSISTTRTETCWSSSRCCPIRRSQNWES